MGAAERVSAGDVRAALSAALPRLGVDAAETSKSARESVGQLEQQLIDVQARLAGVRNDSWEALSDSSSMAQELQTKANTVIHHLQFQDRTSQMLAEAVQQATAVIAVAGLQERQYDDQVIGQVGVLGRQLGTEVEVKAPGSIEMF
jgi:phosphotransferase system HPr-like phosphotransfer protein